MVTSRVRRDRDAALTRALVLMQRYSMESTEIAASTLGLPAATNADLQVLISAARNPAVSSGGLAETTGLRRKDVSAALGVLQAHGLVTRTPDLLDRRVVRVTTTPVARRALVDCDRALADFFRDSAPVVKEVLDLLDHAGRARCAPAVSALGAAERLAVEGRHATADLVRAGRPSGVTSPRQRFAVALLSENATMRPTHLAHELHLSRSATTELIDQLEVRDLVTREAAAGPPDRRAVQVRLTPLGRDALVRIVRALDAHIDPVAAALAGTLHPFASAVGTDLLRP